MAADDEPDAFVISTFAAWAGDDDKLRAVVQALLPRLRTASLEEGVGTPSGIMRFVAFERLRRRQSLNDERDVFTVTTSHAAPASPSVLETSHLRGVIWRLSEREFLLQAYLTDLAWDRQLLERARFQPHQRFELKEPVGEAESIDPRLTLFDRLGASWVVAGNPFVQVEVGDMGLVEALAIWTEPRLEPADGEIILGAFRRLLETLDP